MLHLGLSCSWLAADKRQHSSVSPLSRDTIILQGLDTGLAAVEMEFESREG
jgi:hypothetical protein